MSQHPVDQIIRELIRTARTATSDEIERIIERMATAPFDQRAMVVPTRHRGLAYLGRALGSRDDATFYHLAKRVVVEGEWAYGTTARQYVADLQQVTQQGGARLVVYTRRGGYLAVAVRRTEEVIPTQRRGPRFSPLLVVVYSADRGAIITGYQVSDPGEVGIPEGAQWLR